MPGEGVLQFRADHRQRPLDKEAMAAVAPLLAWRRVLQRLGLIGRQPERYEGLAYGNLSLRLGSESFLVTASQTSHLEAASESDLVVVDGWDLAANRLTSQGPSLPSSESLSHGALYQRDPAIGAVFHGHSPEIWRSGLTQGLPATPEDALNGTVELARALAEEPAFGNSGLIIMAGHEDGVLAYGATAEEAGGHFVTALAKAWQDSRE
ncbi:MAG: class II aldolase/adducin family protein [Acidobacteriota bacterium]